MFSVVCPVVANMCLWSASAKSASHNGVSGDSSVTTYSCYRQRLLVASINTKSPSSILVFVLQPAREAWLNLPAELQKLKCNYFLTDLADKNEENSSKDYS